MPLYDSPEGGMDTQNADSIADEGVAHLNDIGQQEKQASIPSGFDQITYKRGSDGRLKVQANMDEQVFQTIGRWTQMGQQAETAYRGAIAQVEAKRKWLEAHPALASIGAIASRAALEYQSGPMGSRVLPITHSLGAFGASFFGESPEQLAVKEAQLQTENVRTQTPIIAGIESAARLNETENYRANREEDRRSVRVDKFMAPLIAASRIPGGLTERAASSQLQNLVDRGDMTQREKDDAVSGLMTNQQSARDIKRENIDAQNQEYAKRSAEHAADARSLAELQSRLREQDYAFRAKESSKDRQVLGTAKLVESLTKQETTAFEKYNQANAVMEEMSGKLGAQRGIPVEQLMKQFAQLKPGTKEFDAIYGSDPRNAANAYISDQKRLEAAFGDFKAYAAVKTKTQKQIQNAVRTLPKELQDAYLSQSENPPGGVANQVLHDKSKSGKPISSTDGGKTWTFD